MLTDEQLAARKTGIGASDAPIPLGLGRITAAEYVLVHGCGLPAREYPDDLAWLGNAIEAPIVAHYCEHARPGTRVRRFNSTARHPDLPCVIGHPDRLHVGAPRGLEIKWRMSPDGWGADGTDHVPDDVIVQCSQYLSLFPRREAWDVHTMFSRGEFRTYTIGRDQSLIDRILERDAWLWGFVERARAMPPEDRPYARVPDVDATHPTAGEILAIMHDTHDGRTLEVGSDVPAALEHVRGTYAYAAERERHYRTMRQTARAEILAAMQTASVLRFPDGARFVRSKSHASTWTVQRPDGYRLTYKRPRGDEVIE